MKIDLKKMGTRIRKIRGDLSLLEFEAIAHVSRSMLSLYENGEAWPKPDTLNNIATYGKVGTEWVLGFDAAPTIEPPTKEDALRLVLTSDPQLVEKIKDDLRHQIQEETPAYQSRLTSNETRLLKAFSLLDARRQERLIDTAEDMSVALLRGSDQEGTGRGTNCAESNGK
jgi:transcriptional regulator with XRE-family HTH domain